MTPLPKKQVVYISAAQLATRFGVHRATIWRWAQMGRLPQPVRLSTHIVRWQLHEVEAYEARRGDAA